MPTHPARARKLLAQGRAVVASRVPFAIRLKDRKVNDGTTTVQPVGVGIDPGSKHTGLAVFTLTDELDPATGELTTTRHGLFAVQINHRGSAIRDNLISRSQKRRGRRSRNLRYRAPRFNNRTRPNGWLAPSLQHRVDGTASMLKKLRAWFPVTELHQELVRFDTQKMQNPEINGTEYQQGTLADYELREYLLEKYKRTCAYCDAKNVPLNLDHVVARARGGSDRASNRILSCIRCNQAKGAMPVEDFVKDPKRLARILASLTRPLHDAAAVNATRWHLYTVLEATGLPLHTGTGGRTKYVRYWNGLAKTHVNDAMAAGRMDTIAAVTAETHMAKQTGRGTYQRMMSDKFGFARSHRTRIKQHHGFATGDLVRAVIPSGKYSGTYISRVSVRASGNFRISPPEATKAFDVNHRFCTLVQRGNGWNFQAEMNAQAIVTLEQTQQFILP